MARATFNKSSITLRGILGDLISRPDKNDTPITGKATASSRQSLRGESADGNESNGIHPVYQELAKATNKSAYSIALSDRMMPPVIHRILLRGNSILVQASDNVMVAKVEVRVLGEQGEVLEQGDAVRLKGDWWEYMPSYAGVKITATAWDLAGNVTKAEF